MLVWGRVRDHDLHGFRLFYPIREKKYQGPIGEVPPPIPAWNAALVESLVQRDSGSSTKQPTRFNFGHLTSQA